MNEISQAAIHGCLLGTIIGDALGLPYEALSRQRGVRLLGPPDRQRFVFGRGMMSDDGEHACLVAQSFCESGGDVPLFQRALARRLRWWLCGVPAGIGSATLRAVLKLWLGFSPRTSGVFSAGNGPAMRSALLGLVSTDLEHMRELVAASTNITHTDPKARFGALAVALAARQAAGDEPATEFLGRLKELLAGEDAGEFISLLERAVHSATAGESTLAFAEQLGCQHGVSGYTYHTVPVAIHAWLQHPSSYSEAIQVAIGCGGDTDTVAAIVGGIVGSRVGVEGIPLAWRASLLEWPRTLKWIEELATAVTSAAASRQPADCPRVSPAVLVRNLFFVGVVFAHLARRMLPPY